MASGEQGGSDRSLHRVRSRCETLACLPSGTGRPTSPEYSISAATYYLSRSCPIRSADANWLRFLKGIVQGNPSARFERAFFRSDLNTWPDRRQPSSDVWRNVPVALGSIRLFLDQRGQFGQRSATEFPHVRHADALEHLARLVLRRFPFGGRGRRRR